MRRKWNRRTLNIVCITLSVLLMIVLAALLFYSKQEDERQSEELQRLQSEQDAARKAEEEAIAINFVGGSTPEIEDMPNAVCILTPDQFVESVSSSFSNDVITCSELNASGENLLLYFEAESVESCEITVEVYDYDNNRVINAMYYVNSYNSAYYVPLAETESVNSIKFEISDIVSRTGGVTISNVSLLSNQSEAVPSYLSGSFVIDESIETVDLSDDANLSLQKVYDMVGDDNYLYIGSLDTVTIASTDGGNLDVVSYPNGE